MPGNRTDYGTEQTDRAVKRVERRLSSVYREAQRDIDDKLKDWQERHKKRDARYRQMVAAGKMSKEDYRAWVRGQVFQEKQWQARRAEIDNILLNADRAAQNIVNEGKLGVFAANANYMGYALERDSNIDTGFVLYSESTVARLIEDDPQILPKPAPGVQKDLAFPYYNKLMTSAITQGIVQGETISEIAGRVARTTGESSYKSAMRNARTAYTGAQNAGRIEGLHQAQRLGIKVKKKWLAILDSRTRDTHRDLDGQIQEVDDPFKSDLGEIMFPGDPTAKPALVYNCRCTLTYEYPDYPSIMPRRDAENGQIVADMTYREWEALKKGDTNGKATEKQRVNFTALSENDIKTVFGERPDRALRRTDREEYDRQREVYKQSAFGSWDDGLDYEEQMSIADYTSDTYSAINGYCRGEMTEKMVRRWDISSKLPVEQEIKHIEKAINKFELRENIKVYRTCERDVLQTIGNVGDAFKDNGFVSTTIFDKPVASGTVDIVIDVPKGIGRGAWIQPLSGSPDEYEFLLQRGSVFEVTEITETNGRTKIGMTWVGVDADEPRYATREHVIELWKRLGLYDEESAKEI